MAFRMMYFLCCNRKTLLLNHEKSKKKVILGLKYSYFVFYTELCNWKRVPFIFLVEKNECCDIKNKQANMFMHFCVYSMKIYFHLFQSVGIYLDTPDIFIHLTLY